MIIYKFLRNSLFAATAIVVTGCATPSHEAIGSAVPAPAAFLSHVRPVDLGRDLEAVQLVTVSGQTDSLLIEMRVRVQSGHLSLVAQDPTGQRLVTLSWTDKGVTAERAPQLPPVVSPEGLLADMVAICWPEDVVRQALRKTGSELSVRERMRFVLTRGQETLQASLGWASHAPWNGTMTYRNMRAGYRVAVQSIEQP